MGARMLRDQLVRQGGGVSQTPPARHPRRAAPHWNADAPHGHHGSGAAARHQQAGAANDTPCGLAAYFYLQDPARILRVAGRLEAGIVGINRSRAIRTRWPNRLRCTDDRNAPFPRPATARRGGQQNRREWQHRRPSGGGRSRRRLHAGAHNRGNAGGQSADVSALRLHEARGAARIVSRPLWSSPQSHGASGQPDVRYLCERHIATRLRRSAGEAGRVQSARPAVKSSAPAVTDLLGGQVDCLFDSATTSLAQVQSGKLKARAITSNRVRRCCPMCRR